MDHGARDMTAAAVPGRVSPSANRISAGQSDDAGASGGKYVQSAARSADVAMGSRRPGFIDMSDA